MTRKIQFVGIMAIMMLFAASTVALAREAELDDDRGGDRNKGQLVNTIKISDDNSLLRESSTRLTVEPNGKFTASGLVVNSTLTAAGTINVKFFGFNFNIKANGARLEGGSATSTVSEIAVGDRLSVQGSIDQATGVITAEKIVDHSMVTRRTGDIQTRIADLLRLVEQLKEQLRQMSR